MTPTAATARLLLAATAALLALWIVAVWHIGPVIATLTETHGVHRGDLLSLPLGALALWLAAPVITAALRAPRTAAAA